MSAASQRTAITEVNIFNGKDFHQGIVLIDGSNIVTSPSSIEDASIVNGHGKYLLPGLFDCHVHLRDSKKALEELTSYGITTALDMACWPPEVWRSLKQQTHGVCDFLTAGIPATCHGSPHAQVFGALLEDHLIDNPEDAADWVAKRLSEGSDYIKLVADAPVGPTQETLDALVAASHANGKQVICHAFNRKAFEMAIEAKVDAITHAPTDLPLSPESVSLMKSSGSVAIPTLTIEESRSEKYNLNYPAARESVKSMYDAGLIILAGTDSTGTLGPHPLPFGTTLHHEFELLVDAGVSAVDVLRGTTDLAAKYFGLNDRGVIASGKRADLVLLAENPLVDIKNTRKVERVWCAGVEFEGIGEQGPS